MAKARTKEDNFFVGKTEYPFGDDVSKCLAQDIYEANNPGLVDYENSQPLFVGIYRFGSRKLARVLPSLNGQRVLEIGSRSGISTLELFLYHHNLLILGIEKSGGLLDIARYKFNKQEPSESMKNADNPNLLEYWRWFKSESEQYKNKVNFIKEDFDNINSNETHGLLESSFDNAVSHQGMHWGDLAKKLKQTKYFLKKGGSLYWTSSGHVYDDSNPEFSNSATYFKNNDFFKYVLEEAKKLGLKLVSDYHETFKPRFTLEDLKEISSEYGLETTQLSKYPVPVDLQNFLKNHVPAVIRQLGNPNTPNEDLEKITREAIAITINNPKALSDVTHKYDVNPIFRSLKL